MGSLDVPVKVVTISAGKLRRYRHLTFWQHLTVPHVVFGNIGDIGKIIIGFFQSLGLLLRHRPDVVFAKGGYVCLPMGIAAWLLRIPLVIHDSDARPGLTNKLLSRIAVAIATGSPVENYSYDQNKTIYTGVPIGSEFSPISLEKQQILKQQLGIDPNGILVVAAGGGLGSKAINEAALAAALKLQDQQVIIYAVTGKNHYKEIVQMSQGVKNFMPVEFVYEGMASVLGAADIVVSRASATFLQELAGIGKPVIAVPARQLGDQIKNADMYQRAGAVEVLSDDALIEGKLADSIKDLLLDTPKRTALAKNLHSFARPDAASDLSRLIIKAVKSS